MSEARRRYGCRRDTRDARDQSFVLRVARSSPLPLSVDLRTHAPASHDQGDLGSCVGWTVTNALRWHVKRGGAQDQYLSVLQVYYFARLLEKTVKSDAGCELRNAMKAVKKYGVASAKLWPYIPANFDDEPPAEAVRLGQLWSSLTYERVEVGIRSAKVALAAGFPVCIGVSLYSSFESDAVAANGVVPMPDVEKEDLVGGHAMLCLGYEKGHFIVLNSWGTDWGDRGYCYIPEKYVGSTEYGGDYWTIKNLGGS
jgi:C1A family cysteine protease